MKAFISSSSAETKRFAERLARRVTHSVERKRGAVVIALEGELGSGKTTFVQGFFRGLGIRRRAVSPTFILMRRFAIRHLQYTSVYHIDAYRIKRPPELLKLGFKEILRDPQNIVLIEWADKMKRILPNAAVWLYFSHGAKEHERIVGITQCAHL